MIDAGPPGRERAIQRWFKAIDLSPEDLQLVVLTHGHFDHAGTAKWLREFTGASIAIHEMEREWLENGTVVFPEAVSAWGRIMISIGKLAKPWIRFSGTEADIVFGSEGFDLARYGIAGEVIHTPGHTTGSVSVLLETGDAFIGCLAHSDFPFRYGPGLPILADEPRSLHSSWKLLLEKGAKTIYPAHGKPFSAEVMRRILRGFSPGTRA